MAKQGSGFRKIVVSAAVGMLPMFVALLNTLLLWRWIAAESLPEEIGFFAVCTQASLYLGMLQMGLDVSSMFEMTGLLAQGNLRAAADQYHSLRGINRRFAFCIAFVVVAVASICLAGGGISGVSGKVAAATILCVGMTQSVAFLSRTLNVSLAADHHIVTLSWFRVLQSAFAFGAGWLSYLAGAGIASLAIGELASQVAYFCLLKFFCRRYCPWTSLPFTGAARGRDQLRRGASMTLGTLGWAVEAGVDVFLLQLLPNGLGLAAVYTLWFRFPIMAQALCMAISNNTQTALRSAWVSDRPRAVALFRKLFLTQLGLGFFVALSIGLWLPAVIHYWLDGKYDLEEARTVACAMAGFIATRSVCHLLYIACTAFESQSRGNAAVWMCVVAKSVFGVAVAWRFGLSGFLVAGFVSWLATYALLATRLAKLGMASTTALAAGLLVLFGSGAIPWLIQPYIRVDSLRELAVGMAVCAVLAIGGWAGWLIVCGVVHPGRILFRPPVTQGIDPVAP